MNDSSNRVAIADIQNSIATLAANPTWTDGTCRVVLADSKTSLLIIGKGCMGDIVGIAGLRLKKTLERAGFSVFSPLLASGGWLVVADTPGTTPDDEAVAVVRGVLRQVGFALFQEREVQP